MIKSHHLKNIILSGSVLCVALAGAHAPTTKNVTGVYVGGALSYNDLGGTSNQGGWGPGIATPGAAAVISTKGKLSSMGVSEEIFAGYRRNIDSCWFWGAQLAARYYNNQSDKTHYTYDPTGNGTTGYITSNVKIKRTWGYELMLSGGYSFDNSIYAYVGALGEYGVFKVTGTAQETLTATIYSTANKSKNTWGFGPAFGMGYRITKDWTVGARYALTFFQSIQTAFVKNTPRNNALQVNASWTF